VARHFVTLALFFVQPKPPALPVLEIVSPPHRHRRAYPGEAVDDNPDEHPVAESNVVASIESSSLRASSAESTGVLPRLTTYFGPRTELAGLDSRIPPVVR
jgi:hypothetical protein